MRPDENQEIPNRVNRVVLAGLTRVGVEPVFFREFMHCGQNGIVLVRLLGRGVERVGRDGARLVRDLKSVPGPPPVGGGGSAGGIFFGRGRGARRAGGCAG